MKIYIDSEYRCHTTNPDGDYREFEVPFFRGKCDSLIEGYRYIPTEESWTRSDGSVFTGEMVAPWKPYEELDAAQRQYEQTLIADMRMALHTLGVNVDG